ncbi:MAG: hypothetical protein HY515_01400 [Candidatus Aenigmarchaeota archaeon]|nr:hypothetical protein [Candidatus Aenigmarchaeota archaeon]
MDLQKLQESARSICKEYGLDASLFLVEGSGQIIVQVFDPLDPSKSVIGLPYETIRKVAVQLEQEIPGCRVVGLTAQK